MLGIFSFCYSGLAGDTYSINRKIRHSLTLLSTAFKGYAQRLDEQFVVKRLAQESYGPACQSPLACVPASS